MGKRRKSYNTEQLFCTGKITLGRHNITQYRHNIKNWQNRQKMSIRPWKNIRAHSWKDLRVYISVCLLVMWPEGAMWMYFIGYIDYHLWGHLWGHDQWMCCLAQLHRCVMCWGHTMPNGDFTTLVKHTMNGLLGRYKCKLLQGTDQGTWYGQWCLKMSDLLDSRPH